MYVSLSPTCVRDDSRLSWSPDAFEFSYGGEDVAEPGDAAPWFMHPVWQGTTPVWEVDANAPLTPADDFVIIEYRHQESNWANMFFRIQSDAHVNLTVAAEGPPGAVSGPIVSAAIPALACRSGERFDETGVCHVSIQRNLPTTLEAQPVPGQRCGAWSGSCVTSNPAPSGCFLEVRAAEAVTCTHRFERNDAELFELTLGVEGQGTVTVEQRGRAVDCSSGQCSLERGTPVTLVAEPGSGWRFGGWGGDCSAGGGDLSFTTTFGADASCTSAFEERPRSRIEIGLTPSASGQRLLASSPSIDPPSVCSADRCSLVTNVFVGEDVEIVLDQPEPPQWRVGAWNGDCDGVGDRAILTVVDGSNQCFAQLVEINNEPPGGTREVTFETVGDGNLVVFALDYACSGADRRCVEQLPINDAVNVVAVPRNGWDFDGWERCDGTENGTTCALPGGVDETVRARFVPAAGLTLIGEVINNGSGDLEIVFPSGGSCGTDNDCIINDVQAGETYVFSAAPRSGFRFSEWGGACAGTNIPMTLVIDPQQADSQGRIRCEARFAPIN